MDKSTEKKTGQHDETMTGQRDHLRNSDADRVLAELCSNPKVQEMKQYIQHGKVCTYDHCKAVARMCSKINRNFRLNADEKILLRSAMLHDFYLYDWHDDDGGSHDWHGFIHAERAADNARRYLNVSDEEMKVIRSHMWPLNMTKVPSSREAWILWMADKAVSLHETLFQRKEGGSGGL